MKCLQGKGFELKTVFSPSSSKDKGFLYLQSIKGQDTLTNHRKDSCSLCILLDYVFVLQAHLISWYSDGWKGDFLEGQGFYIKKGALIVWKLKLFQALLKPLKHFQDLSHLFYKQWNWLGVCTKGDYVCYELCWLICILDKGRIVKLRILPWSKIQK